MAAKTVAVYGSAMITPDEAIYTAAHYIGQALAEAGYVVMTGGYAGVMEAASHGAAEAGGHVIGVPSTTIEKFRPTARVNQWVKEKFGQTTLRGRLMFLTLRADAYVVLPGGTGTLAELMIAWELVRTGDVPKKPIVCYGPYWANILALFRQSPHIAANAWETLSFADSPQQVVAIIKASLAHAS